MSNLINDIKNLSINFIDYTVRNRRHLHENPELSFQEYETSEFIQKKLEEIGIECEKKAGTGLVGVVEGKGRGIEKTVVLRADIDALPIREETELSFKSANEGVMHACGHDVHTSLLITAMRILKGMEEQFSGTIKFLFQPAEERIPGGAIKMIEEGVLSGRNGLSIIGQHTMPEMEAGKVGFCGGSYMASSDELYITILGKGGHGAMPDLNIDPVTIACQLICSLQQVVSRMAKPQVPTVLSFGKIIGNGAANVIPEQVQIAGTFRTMDEKWRQEAHKKIEKLVFSIVEGYGATCEFELKKGYPVLYNNPQLTEETKRAAINFLGQENVINLDPWMASEDFAYYTQEIPGCYYRLGTGFKDGNGNPGLHSPHFKVNEKALELGPGLMAYLALSSLKG